MQEALNLLIDNALITLSFIGVMAWLVISISTDHDDSGDLNTDRDESW